MWGLHRIIKFFLDFVTYLLFSWQKLSASLINEAWIRFTSRKRNPLSEKEASEINPIVESFLKHEAIRYQKRLMHQRRTQSWPECPTSLSFKKIPYICVTNSDAQTDNITCDH